MVANMDAANNQSCSRLLDQLQTLVARQKELLARQDYQSVDATGATFNSLLNQLAQFAPLDDPASARVAQIADTHQRLCLALAAQKQQTAQRLGKLTTGARVLRAYRPSTPQA
jgi:hypothetical protein